MSSAKKKTAAMAVILALLLALACCVLSRSVTASAYDGLPGEFGSKVGETIAVGDVTYDNYQRGYEKKENGVVVAHVGGKNVDASGNATLIDAATMTSVKNWGTLVNANSSGNRIAYGPGWNADAAAAVGNAFKAKWEELIESEYNLGIPCSDINLYKGGGDGEAVVFGMEFRYGDSTYDPDNGSGGRKNMSYLYYNALEDKVYLVKDAFMRVMSGETNEVRRIGAPVSEQLTGIKVTGLDGEGNNIDVTNAKVQVFETGILIAGENSDNPERVEKHEGVVEKISDTEYKMYPLLRDQDIMAKNSGGNLSFIGDVDGTWHALRTARVVAHSGGKMTVQFNFRAGCIEVVYNDDYTLSSRMAYAGQNYAYDEQGNASRVTLPYENFTTDEHLWEKRDNAYVDNEAHNMYVSFAGNSGKSDADLQQAFRNGYKALFDEGIIPGYRCSWIKVWTVICADYKYSPDSLRGFDGVGSAGRERMFTLVYSSVQDKVYGVGDDFWQVWKEDNTRPALGAPISNVLRNHVISGTTYKRIQIFEKGYIYENGAGNLIVETGTTTDNEYKEFLFTAAPVVPQQYGGETERIESEDGKTVYINFGYGAVKAEKNVLGNGYFYEMFPGRNFVEKDGAYVAEMLDMETLYPESVFVHDVADWKIESNNEFDDFTDGDGNFVTGAKESLITMVRDMLEHDVFPGFFDNRGFTVWNNTKSLQTLYGDSCADPWGGDSRTNVAVFVWNEQQKKLYYMDDAVVRSWGADGGTYTALGAPASDEFKLDIAPNLTFRMFEDGQKHDGKAFCVYVGKNEIVYFRSESGMTPEKYAQEYADLYKPLEGVKITAPETTVYYIEDVDFIELKYEILGGASDVKVEITSSDPDVGDYYDGAVEFYETGKFTITVSVSDSDGLYTYTDTITFEIKSHDKPEKKGCSSDLAATSGFAAIVLVICAGCFIGMRLIKKGAKTRK